ncbi:MAG: hypothetical protein ACKOBA_09550, partial [Limnohabitans sp.]
MFSAPVFSRPWRSSTSARRRGRWLGLIALGGLVLAARAADPVCNSSSHATLLQAQLQTDPTGTQALWLDAHQVLWPGQRAGAGQRWRLLVSDSGQLRWRLGAPAAGHDMALSLLVSGDAAAAGTAARWRYAGSGLRLQLADTLSPSAQAALHARLHAGQS